MSSEERPTWRKRVEVRFHLMMCVHCRKYARQLELMKAGFKKLFSSTSIDDTNAKVEALEREVIRKIEK